MRPKQTWDSTRTRRNIAVIATVLVSSTMLVGCASDLSGGTKPRQMQAIETQPMEAQSLLAIKREMMPENLEGALKAIPGSEETHAVITLGRLDLKRPGAEERVFLTAERFNDPDALTRTVNLEQAPMKLEMMPENLEGALKATPGLEETNAVITFGPNGQERTFLTAERFDESGNLTIQPFPTDAERINGVFRTRSGVVYLSWEASPDDQCQTFPAPPYPCHPVSHPHPH